MGLVGYSDSEGSDDEQDTREQTSQANQGKAAKSTFQKVVHGSKPNRIQVNLPKADVSDAGDSIEPATKRARTTGAFSGFSSFLPAPKNAAAKAAASETKNEPSSSNRLGRGVSLKTGATPAFSRDAIAYSENDVSASITAPPPAEDEVKLVGKPMAFKPLSVSRKPKGKKSVGAAASANARSSTASSSQPSSGATAASKAADSAALPPPKQKKSLFSAIPDEARETSEPSVASEYTPITLENESHEESVEVPQADSVPPQPTAQPAAQQNNLSALATSLNLSASERRQLFGRNGPSDAQVAQFNLAAEYQSNRELAESGETAPAHNPVRSIAGGKHSLQQLINNAASQKDALEESFARGKGNKREAGSKYGW